MVFVSIKQVFLLHAVPKMVPFSGDLHPFGKLQENLMPDSFSEKIQLQGNYIYHGSKKSSLFVSE